MRTTPIATAVSATALALAPFALATPALASTPETTPAHSAAYLATQLAATDGVLQVEAGGQTYDDWGVTIDAVLAIQSTRTADTQAAASAQRVLDNAGSYTGSGYGDLYAGSTGKLLVLTASRGLPTTVGGTDYLAGLQGLEQENGHFADQSAYGDYSNSLSQSFALIGLKRNGVNPSTASVGFLLEQQCADGGFSLEYKDGCISDPDATSVAVQALTAVGGQDAAIGRAADYLVTQQGAHGGVNGGTTTEGPNANSTGLAAVALRLAGRTDALASARGYLASVTFGCEHTHLAAGIAYDVSSFGSAATDAPANDHVNRTTAQALIGLTDVSYVDVSAAGASGAAVALECDDAPTPTPTTSDDDSTPTATPTATTEPKIPAEVRTDSYQGSPATLVAGLVTLGALLGGGLLVAVRREGGAHR